MLFHIKEHLMLIQIIHHTPSVELIKLVIQFIKEKMEQMLLKLINNKLKMMDILQLLQTKIFIKVLLNKIVYYMFKYLQMKHHMLDH